MLGAIASAVGEAGGDMGGIDIVQVRKENMIRDFTVAVRDEAHAQSIVHALKKIAGVHVRSVSIRCSSCTWAARSKCAARWRSARGRSSRWSSPDAPGFQNSQV